MPLPSNVTTRTVTGTYVDFAGVAMSGSVTFTPPDELIDSAASVFLSAGPIVCELDQNGHFSVVLPCTDNPSIGVGWVYLVTENVRGLRSYTIELPHTLPNPVDLSALAPATGV